MKLREILDDSPVTASPDESAGAAWERMRSQDTAHLVVIKDDRVVGLVSRHDLGGPAGGAHRRMGRRVADLMQRDVVTATPETSVMPRSANHAASFVTMTSGASPDSTRDSRMRL